MPSEGTVSAITAGAAAVRRSPAPGGGTGAGVRAPRRSAAVTVADAEPRPGALHPGRRRGGARPDHQRADHGARRRREHGRAADDWPGSALPARTNGARGAGDGARRPARRTWSATAAGAAAVRGARRRAPSCSPAVAWAGRFYCADDAQRHGATSSTRAGKLVDTIDVPAANGPLELEVRENHLFINAPELGDRAGGRRQARGAGGRQVRQRHPRWRPAAGPADAAAGQAEAVVGKPGAPRNVTAAAGNAQARVSWRAGRRQRCRRSPGTWSRAAAQPFEVGANQRSLEITGLTNGETYRFSVHAVNGKGAGPAKQQQPGGADLRGARRAGRA